MIPVALLDGMTLQVGAVQYDVRVKSDLTTTDGRSLAGQIAYHELEIAISLTLNPHLTSTVLWHELIHAMCEQTGREHDEGLCNAVSYFVAQVLHDNPQLTAMFLKDAAG